MRPQVKGRRTLDAGRQQRWEGTRGSSCASISRGAPAPYPHETDLRLDLSLKGDAMMSREATSLVAICDSSTGGKSAVHAHCAKAHSLLIARARCHPRQVTPEYPVLQSQLPEGCRPHEESSLRRRANLAAWLSHWRSCGEPDRSSRMQTIWLPRISGERFHLLTKHS